MCDLGITGMTMKSHIQKTCLEFVTRNPLSFFDRVCSYSAQYLPIVCRLKHRFQNTHMTLESKVKVKNFTKSVLFLETRNTLIFYLFECVHFNTMISVCRL